jgi:hypothetical protein
MVTYAMGRCFLFVRAYMYEHAVPYGMNSERACIYTCAYIHMDTDVCTFAIHTCICICIYIHVCMYVCMYACTCVCMYACIISLHAYNCDTIVKGFMYTKNVCTWGTVCTYMQMLYIHAHRTCNSRIYMHIYSWNSRICMHIHICIRRTYVHIQPRYV